MGINWVLRHRLTWLAAPVVLVTVIYVAYAWKMKHRDMVCPFGYAGQGRD